MRISDWSSDVCSSDLERNAPFDGFVSIAADQKTLTLKELRGGRTQTLTGFDDLLVGDGDLVFQHDPLARKRGWVAGPLAIGLWMTLNISAIALVFRSEERRVGYERVSTCSTRWSPYH